MVLRESGLTGMTRLMGGGKMETGCGVDLVEWLERTSGRVEGSAGS